jgi:hypothetical protein
MLQMRVIEGGRILQSEAYRPIKGNMSKPNQSERQQLRFMPAQGHSRQSDGKHFRVHKVIKSRADSRVRPKSNHKKIGPEKKHEKYPPLRSDGMIEKKTKR